METVFLISAVIGGTIFLFQLVTAIVGFGADDLDIPDDLDVDLHAPDGDLHGHGSTWFFGVVSFRTVVAAITFFGLTGLAATQGGASALSSLTIAILAGTAAMYGVHYLMLSISRLRHDGTVKIERSIGKRGTVYVPIPADRSGAGKIQLELQSRIMEYPAVTGGHEALPTGTQIEVVDVVTGNTLEVKAISETA